MPTFKITDHETGDTLVINADKEPTEADVGEIFQKQRLEKPKLDTGALLKGPVRGEQMGTLGPIDPTEGVRVFRDIPAAISTAGQQLTQPLADIATEYLKTSGMDPGAEPDKPLIDLGILAGEKKPDESAARASARRLLETAAGFTTPRQAAMLPFLPFKAVQGLFGAEAAAGIPQSIEEIGQSKTPAELSSGLTGAAANLLIAGSLGKHLLKDTGTTIPQPEIPIKTEVKDAPQERVEQKGSQPEHIGTEAQRIQAVSGGGDSPKPETPVQAEVAPDWAKRRLASVVKKRLGKPYNQGLEDAKSGKSESDNPYVENSTEASAWLRGFKGEGEGSELKTKTLTPAIQAGDKVFTGKSHADAFKAVVDAYAKDKITDEQYAAAEKNFKDDKGHVFLADDGKTILDRERGADWFKSTTGKEPTTAKGKLHSEDMTDEQKGFRTPTTPTKQTAKEYLREVKKIQEEASKLKPAREIVEPAKDTKLGKNAAGEEIFQRKDGSVYRMRFDSPKTKPYGYPDFGGDLSPVETQPELVGMGGAVPGEFQGQGTPTSNKNAVVDRERTERGLQPMMAALKQTFGEWWTKAMARIDQDPGYQDRLISELLEKPRALTGEENAALLQRRADLRNEYEKAARDGAQAYEDGRDDGVQEARQRIAMWSDKLVELEQAVGKGGAGTESGRSLAARKMMMNSDFSLASLEMQKRAAKGFEPLTDKERQELIDLHNKLQATEKAYQDYVTQSQNRISELESQKKIAEIRSQVPPIDKRVLDFAESIVSKMEKAAEPAAQRLRERLSRLSAGVDPLIISDAAIVGSAKIARMGLDLAKWTDAMVKDFGEKIKPMLQDIWAASNQLLEERLSKTPEAVKKHVKKQDPIAAIDTNKTAIGEKVRKGEQAEITPLVQKLVRAIVERDPKIERGPLVDEVHGILKEFLPAITKREAMDAISGYGDFRQLTKDQISQRVRDLKGQLQQVAKLEDIQARKPPLKSGVERRTPSDEERKLIKQVNELKRRLGVVVTDPATQLKSALDARKTYYKNQIADLEAQIKAKERFVKTKTPSPTDAELENLKKQRDAAKAEFDKLFNVRQETGLETLKAKLRKNIEDLERKIREGDFSTRPKKPPIVLDSEAQSLKAKNERLKRDFQAALIRDRLKNRTNWEKALDWGVKYRRFGVLSSPMVIPKLISAGVQRLASLPLEELAASASKIIPGVAEVAKRAPLEGEGLNMAAEMKGYKAAFMQGLKDAYDVLKTGHSELDVLYGKPKESYTGEFELGSQLLALPGRLHGMIKAPVKRATFERAVDRLANFYSKQGLDVADPMVRARIGIEAYKAANRSIFLNDNFIASKVNAFLSEVKDPATGHTRMGSKVWSTVGRVALPITRVPINIVAETMQYVGGLASGSVRLANALRKGVENLPPEQADLIMRELKKGSVGGAVLLLGYLNSDVIGGYYQPGEKRKPGDVKAGKIRAFGVDIPSWLLHNPLLETAQFGATIRRFSETRIKGEEQGIPAGVGAAALGLIEQVPFVRESLEIEKAMDPKQRGKFLGEQAKSIVVPAAVQRAAEWMDPAEKRKPRTVLEHIESGIPILRENVPQ